VALLDRHPGTHAVIAVDGIPVGYLCWAPPDAAELTAAGLTDLPAALVDIDILIGEPRFLGREIGPCALCLLLDRLRQQAEFRWAGLATSQSNHAAISAFEKAGFRLFRVFDDPEWGPCRYMVIEVRGAV
jgi:RimJ/RimL family protein N-acetyltransferase